MAFLTDPNRARRWSNHPRQNNSNELHSISLILGRARHQFKKKEAVLTPKKNVKSKMKKKIETVTDTLVAKIGVTN